MIEISHLSFLVFAELLLILCITCGIFLFQSIRGRKRDYQAARKLVSAIQQQAQQRTTSVRKLLETDYRYAGEELDQTLRNLLHTEKLFYQTFINAYLNREAKTFAQLNSYLQALTDIYEQLKMPTSEASAEQGEPDQDVELQYLQDKNQRLAEELSETMDTMGRMLSEYSNMFQPSEDATVDEVSLANVGDTTPAVRGETDSAELEITSRPASGDTEPQDSSPEQDRPLESLEITEDAVEELLQDVAQQVADDAEAPADESEELDLESIDLDVSHNGSRVVEGAELSNALEDLEEIDIEVDISPQAEEGGSRIS